MKLKYNVINDKVQSVVIFCSNPNEFKMVKWFLTFKEKTRRYDYKTKKATWMEIDMHTAISVSEKKLFFVVRYGLAKVVQSWLDSIEYYYDIENEPIYEKLKIEEKWLNVFANHPKPEYGKNQLAIASEIECNNLGIVSLHVGGGKSELILATVESFLNDERFKGKNAMVISFSKKVIDEIKLRAEKYNVSSDRFKIIQPNGYMRRKEAKEQDFLSFCSNTELLIADEAHHFTAQSWKDLYDLIKPKYMYAYTGSADIEGGDRLDWNTFNDGKANLQSAELMSFCGEMLVHLELKVPIKIYRSYHKLTNRTDYEEYKKDNPDSLFKLVQFTLRNENLPRLIASAINNYVPEDSLVFIPELTSIETGVFLSDELNKLGIPTVYYSAEYVNSPLGKIDLPLEELKKLAYEKQFKVLIANVVGVEGLDLANLSSIIPLSGVSFKSIIQPIGRSARSDLIHCVFIFDDNNPMYNRQNNKRYETVKSKLNVISDEIVDIK